MNVHRYATADEAGRAAAQHLMSRVATLQRPVIGVATGGSPVPLYSALRGVVEDGVALGWSEVFALDEYVGLPAGHPQSYREVIDRQVTRPLRLDSRRVHVPYARGSGRTELEAAAADYDTRIRAAGGIDVQILGLGHNGHIGFNEPGSPLSSRTRVVDLAHQTREANARFFDSLDAVPSQAVTQGVGTIMEARHLVLLVHGSDKAAIVARALQGPVDAACPGSVLQLHPSLEVYLDRAAATFLDAGSRLADDPHQGSLVPDRR